MCLYIHIYLSTYLSIYLSIYINIYSSVIINLRIAEKLLPSRYNILQCKENFVCFKSWFKVCITPFWNNNAIEAHYYLDLCNTFSESINSKAKNIEIIFSIKINSPKSLYYQFFVLLCLFPQSRLKNFKFTVPIDNIY